MGVTACQDPHEEPRTPFTTSDGRQPPEPPPRGGPYAAMWRAFEALSESPTAA